ncbi:MAG: TetR/AcrR family transcriptional regulator [Bdellovibrionia bacterium]
MNKLMQAGLEVFSECGFNGTTTRMISQRSGVNESLIIRYFNSKSGLFLAIILDTIRRFMEEVRSYPIGETVEQEIENYLSFKYRASLANPGFTRLIVSQLAIDPEIRAQVDTCAKSVLKEDDNGLYGRLRDFQKRGKIRKDVDLEVATKVIEQQAMATTFLVSMTPESDEKEILAGIKFFAREMGRSLGMR